MHHYGEDSIEIRKTPTGYEAIFTNKVTGAKVSLRIPRQGAFEDPNRKMEENEFQRVAEDIAHRLRENLGGHAGLAHGAGAPA